ncbi:MAG TPA: DUF4097 family beta strand repeat-containing protein [Gemmatimonadales bacterium]|jgi:DUF4097 and DUF4098 domain-containing protein YvlB
MLFLFALLGATTALSSTDTIIPVRGGSRLELSSAEGGITVQTWGRAAIRVQADHDEDTRIDIDQGGRAINLRARGRYGPPEVTWRLTIPADMALDLATRSGDVSISGTKGEVSVSTVEGNITVEGGGGFVSLQSIEGDVALTGSAGRISVTTVDGGITIREATGSVRVTATDGDIVLENIESGDLEVTTVDGDIRFSGAIRAGGRYRLSSHDGDVTVIAPVINAEVSISSFSGDFESDYPVTFTGPNPRGRMNFTLGSGGGRLELESFDGTIALRKSAGRAP